MTGCGAQDALKAKSEYEDDTAIEAVSAINATSAIKAKVDDEAYDADVAWNDSDAQEALTCVTCGYKFGTQEALVANDEVPAKFEYNATEAVSENSDKIDIDAVSDISANNA